VTGTDRDCISGPCRKLAIRDGARPEALAEVKALPPEAQDPMSDWLADGARRATMPQWTGRTDIDTTPDGELRELILCFGHC